MAKREDEWAQLAQLQRQWLEAKAGHDALGRQFVWIGDVRPGEDIVSPPRVADMEGVLEVQAAAEREQAVFKSYREALARYIEGNE